MYSLYYSNILPPSKHSLLSYIKQNKTKWKLEIQAYFLLQLLSHSSCLLLSKIAQHICLNFLLTLLSFHFIMVSSPISPSNMLLVRLSVILCQNKGNCSLSILDSVDQVPYLFNEISYISFSLISLTFCLVSTAAVSSSFTYSVAARKAPVIGS